MLVGVSVGCHRNSSGTGQTSSGSVGRSAHCHQACRPAHRHRERQILRPSSSRLDSTGPPDFKGWLHSGQDGASSVMRRTLIERPLRPEATLGVRWTWDRYPTHLLRLSVAVRGCPLPSVGVVTQLGTQQDWDWSLCVTPVGRWIQVAIRSPFACCVGVPGWADCPVTSGSVASENFKIRAACN